MKSMRKVAPSEPGMFPGPPESLAPASTILFTLLALGFGYAALVSHGYLWVWHVGFVLACLGLLASLVASVVMAAAPHLQRDEPDEMSGDSRQIQDDAGRQAELNAGDIDQDVPEDQSRSTRHERYSPQEIGARG